MVRVGRLELPSLAATEPKSVAYANFATPAKWSRRRGLNPQSLLITSQLRYQLRHVGLWCPMKESNPHERRVETCCSIH